MQYAITKMRHQVNGGQSAPAWAISLLIEHGSIVRRFVCLCRRAVAQLGAARACRHQHRHSGHRGCRAWPPSASNTESTMPGADLRESVAMMPGGKKRELSTSASIRFACAVRRTARCTWQACSITLCRIRATVSSFGIRPIGKACASGATRQLSGRSKIDGSQRAAMPAS